MSVKVGCRGVPAIGYGEEMTKSVGDWLGAERYVGGIR